MGVTSTLKIDINRIVKSTFNDVDYNTLPFGRVFSDHMFAADFVNGQWENLSILPYGNISLPPASSALHYGQSIFEGMKTFKNKDGEILLFRPLDNHKRLNRSAARMCMPALPEEIFMEGLTRLLKFDSSWVPFRDGNSLYIRPFMFATDELIGVKPSEKYKFMIFTCPVGSYYNENVRVKIETNYVRAASGGVGAVKAAGNYGAALYPAKLGQEKGYHQLVWTDAHEHKYIEESGTMNVMFVLGNKLITPLVNSTTLAGITRDSVLQIARDWDYSVEERKISVAEIIQAHSNGSLSEGFGTGTAATIAHFEKINFENKDYMMPEIKESNFSNRVKIELDNIKRGKIKDTRNWIMIC